jgi:hypothetical protein
MLTVTSGRIEEFVGDNDYPLELRIGELRALQASINSGPAVMLSRLQDGAWFVDDIIEPIRLGLIGAGMEHRAAKRLVDTYITGGALLQYLPVALKVILAALIGNEEDQPDLGEPMAPMNPTTGEDS